MGRGIKCGSIWGEFISWFQVQVLFERISSTRLKEYLAKKSENISQCTKCPLDI
jgi:hypothetical protein